MNFQDPYQSMTTMLVNPRMVECKFPSHSGNTVCDELQKSSQQQVAHSPFLSKQFRILKIKLKINTNKYFNYFKDPYFPRPIIATSFRLSTLYKLELYPGPDGANGDSSGSGFC